MCLNFLFYAETDDYTDTDEFDESSEVNNPASPIWQGSEVHSTPFGTDTTVPDPNEITQD